MSATIEAGKCEPLGATIVNGGINFAVFSQHGTKAFVCLFDAKDPSKETARLQLPGRTAHVFHGFVPNLPPGTVYGFRVDGPFEPAQGHRFNVNKLLVDPYARALIGKVDWQGPIFGFPLDAEEKDLARDDRDDAAAVPKAVVNAESFDWEGDRPPGIPWADTLIYELHVKGFTKRHPDVPPAAQGTYLGLCHPKVIDELKALQVTSVELLPIHEFVDDGLVLDRGLVNYWGYNTIGFFAPSARYASTPGAAVREFKEMVKTLHQAGIEVILDVVYNHTAEGNQLGPTLSFRGLDNRAYYQLSPDDRRYYMEFTGCGNSVHGSHPYVLKLIMDSLRHWVREMHVDGFRFDIAPTLFRGAPDFLFSPDAPLLQAIHQDPILGGVKLIAEPWDLGPEPYQVGRFPILWSEWNGRFRDTARQFWRGDDAQAAPMGRAMTASPDLFEAAGRTARASINFVTCHDGFTLHDLVSFNAKRNEANGEENHDGIEENLSWNHGAEGETEDRAIVNLREQQKRNFLATLLLGRGVPMLLAGDERGRTQKGNNNGYCQDNEVTWVDWTPSPAASGLRDFTILLAQLRSSYPMLRCERFLRGGDALPEEERELSWFRADGKPMTEGDWANPESRSLALLLHPRAAADPACAGNPPALPLLLVMNACQAEVAFRLPAAAHVHRWEPLFDTARMAEKMPAMEAGKDYPAAGRSFLALRGLNSAS